MIEKYITFAASERGYNHIKSNKVCEDYSDCYDLEGTYICAVADGHGSDNYPRTDEGAKLAVASAIKCVLEFVEDVEKSFSIDEILSDEKKGFSILLQLSKSILLDWHNHVDKHYDENPFTDEELTNVSEKYKSRYLSSDDSLKTLDKGYYKAYGCTLILFVITERYSFGIQIGDGKCVVIDNDGVFTEPIPWDENCQLNVTTSICDNDAIDEFRFFVTENHPVAVFCGSDGIDDSYASTEELYALYRSIIKIYAEHGEEVGKQEIKEYLPVLTKKGSGDDVSIGLILNMDEIKKLLPVFNLQSELFKLEEKEKEKKQQLNTNLEKDSALSKRIKKWCDSGTLSNENYQDDCIRLNEIRTLREDIENDLRMMENQKKELLENLSALTSGQDICETDNPDIENAADYIAVEDNAVKTDIPKKSEDADIIVVQPKEQEEV